MAKRRLIVGPDGRLRNHEGKVLGRLVSMTIDVGTGGAEEGGTTGGEIPSSQQTLAVGLPEVNSSERGAGREIALVWAHFQKTIAGAERQTLDPTRTTIMRNALKVATVEECCAAIDGLAASPHHNGRNEQQKKYLGIRYALKGDTSKGESNDERIGKMAEKAGATVDAVLANIPSAGRAMVRDRQRQVEDMLLHPGDENRRARGVGSEKYLAEQFGLHARTDGQGGVVWERKA